MNERKKMRRQDLTGKKFGLGKVDSFSHNGTKGVKRKRSTVVWNLSCECGNKYQSSTELLHSGDVISCGCSKFKFHSLCFPKSIGRWWKVMVNGARKRGIDIQVTKQECLDLLEKQDYKCKLSGITISIELGTASIDRIDSSVSYVLSNVQWVYRKINYMKNSLPENEFIYLCSLVSENMSLSPSISV